MLPHIKLICSNCPAQLGDETQLKPSNRTKVVEALRIFDGASPDCEMGSYEMIGKEHLVRYGIMDIAHSGNGFASTWLEAITWIIYALAPERTPGTHLHRSFQYQAGIFVYG